jgi:hypothetical protein
MPLCLYLPASSFFFLLKSYLLIIGIPGFFFRFFKLPANYYDYDILYTELDKYIYVLIINNMGLKNTNFIKIGGTKIVHGPNPHGTSRTQRPSTNFFFSK